jgi:hypothetical protein
MIVVSAVADGRQATARGVEMRGSYLRMREEPENALGLSTTEAAVVRS